MKQKKLLLMATIFLGALLWTVFTSCDSRKDAIGSEDKILVIADSTDWVVLQDSIRAVFEKIRLTPQPEKIFILQKVEPNNLAKVKNWKNILLVGTLQTSGAIGKLLANALDAEARARVEQDSAFVFVQNNAWSLNQTLMVLVARDLETLNHRLSSEKSRLFKIFDDQVNKIIKNQMYRMKEQKDLSEQLLKKYGWQVRVQHDYFIALEDDTNKVIWLRRFGMGESGSQRWMLVHWVDAADPALIEDPQWTINLRNQLATKYYEGDQVLPEYLGSEIVNFLDRRAMQIDGLWENNTLMVGGPFRTFAFYEESDGRIYLIDLAVLAPGEKKLPFMRQLDIMAHTFATRQKARQ